MKKKTSFYISIVNWLASQTFFRLIVGLFALQAAWIALSANYPMAFDEDFHFGLIKLYADHWSPFWSSQPANADIYGAVVRDPSYLYHYLMSFPYRVISLLTHDQMQQILWLRFLNIGLFASGLAIYRRLLLKTGASRALVHSCLFIFILIPIVPLLGAHINYDSLFIPAVGLLLLLAVSFSERLHAGKALDGTLLLGILVLGLLASLIKYAFLPILVMTLAFMMIRLWRTYSTLPEIGTQVWKGVKLLSRRAKVLFFIGLLVAIGLCGERYGYNLVRYHNPIPDCSKVLTIERCSSYGPWNRDYKLAQTKTSSGDGPGAYVQAWTRGMARRLFFTLDGPTTYYQTRDPLTMPAIGAQIFAITGLLLLLAYGRKVLTTYRNSALIFLLILTAVYAVVLWLDGYEVYHRTGKAVAVNGRYLLPILLPAFLLAGLSFSVALQERLRLKLAVAVVAAVCMLWGGGAMTYILRSNDAWYWPSSSLRGVNHSLQNSLGPLTPGYDSGQPSRFTKFFR